jgi:hypothetical protein
VLGTLSAAEGVVKRFEKIRFPPNVDNFVETMCTVPWWFVDQKWAADRTTAEPMWKPVRQWSDLISLAI